MTVLSTPKNIRADIGYIKKNVQKYGEKIPKFPSVEFERIHIVTDNIVYRFILNN